MIGLVPFVATECLLRAFDVGRPDSYEDPFVAFSEAFTLFEYDRSKSVYRIAKHHHYFFGEQEFPAKKTKGTYRVFCLGGSTVLGHPYDTATSFPKWLELELNARRPDQTHEVINCGGMSYASYRIVPILQEVLTHEPDLIVVMTGHNEFLEDRTYRNLKSRSAWQIGIDETAAASRLVTLGRRAVKAFHDGTQDDSFKTELPYSVDAKLDHSSGYASYQRDPQWWEDVIGHFSHNLRVMIRKCEQVTVPLVLVNPGANLRDCPPFKSQHKADLSLEELSSWNRIYAEANELAQKEPQAALALYLDALKIDSQFAELAFRIATMYDELGKTDEALTYYEKAKELDTCPLRILHSMRQCVIETAESTSTPLLDATEILHSNLAPSGLVGFDRYVDHVHPNIDGHQQLARRIVQELVTSEIIEPLPPWPNYDRRSEFLRHLGNQPAHYFQQGRRRVEWLDNWGRRKRSQIDTNSSDFRKRLDDICLAVAFGENELAESLCEELETSHDLARSVVIERAFELFRSGQTRGSRILLSSLSKLPQPQRSVEHRVACFALDQAEGVSVAAQLPEGLMPSEMSENARRWIEELEDAEELFR